ncbi:hypothetical protein K402DRAFT_417098 [Aulographum hederae CBS 113979]|uniref:Uncharacterized protein n=1 Tax=Aulographum hederae CBS 113979 TaxID=1176131 RepID=A0A6G1HDK5_9PEZI|nr:hypothetical protein K402DRAFT_417098 [Aulographum hederae CBS 113979]
MSDETKEQRILREIQQRDDELRRPAKKIDVLNNSGFDNILKALPPFLLDAFGPFERPDEEGDETDHALALLEKLGRALEDTVTGVQRGDEEVANLMRGFAGRDFVAVAGDGGGDDDGGTEEKDLKTMVSDVEESFRESVRDLLSSYPEKFSPLWKHDGKWTAFKTLVGEAYVDGVEKSSGNHEEGGGTS